MITNYFKIAWRNLIRNKIYSFINIGGLAVGMTVAVLIGLWVWDELMFDHYHKNHDRIAQVMTTQTLNGETTTVGAVPIPLANALRTNYGTIFKRTALVFPAFPHILSVGDKQVSQPGVWAQPDLPDMLSFEMVKGRRDALNDPSSALLAQSLATALFGQDEALGKTIKLDNRTTVTVAGVFRDFPQSTTFHDTKLFLSWNKVIADLAWVNEAQTDWHTALWHLFVELNEPVDADKLNAQLADVAKPYLPQNKTVVQLHQMNDWHLYSQFVNGQASGGRIDYVWLFGLIGGFVLLLACINFMNLSTARSEKRAKEVGIRKAVGSGRGQLVGQFFGESLLVAFLALLIALLLVQTALPFFNALTDKAIFIPSSSLIFWLLVLGFTVFTGLIAGSYSAFYLSGFAPVKVLSGKITAGRFAALPRKTLVVMQFTVSITLIVGTIVVFEQIQHAKNRPVGYTRDGLITIQKNTPALFQMPYNIVRDELLQTGVVANMAGSSVSSTETPTSDQDFSWEGKPSGLVATLQVVSVTHDYGQTLGWTIVAGRDFARSFPSDSGALVINKAMAKLVSVKNEDAELVVGKTIRWAGKPHQIVGVVSDVVMESPFEPVQPALFMLDYSGDNFTTIRINPTVPTRTALAKIETVFKKYNPGSPFTYSFVDTQYAQKFLNEERISKLASIFTVLAIFISCLGLFGLASFMAEQRTKEIGIRKVLGASVSSLWVLLSKDFVGLIVIACLLAVPIAGYFLSDWLGQYRYRTTLNWWTFVAAGGGALVITLLTVSYQAIKAALMNPVKSLRSE